MTVGELIHLLENYDKDLPVLRYDTNDRSPEKSFAYEVHEDTFWEYRVAKYGAYKSTKKVGVIIK